MTQLITSCRSITDKIVGYLPLEDLETSQASKEDYIYNLFLNRV